MMQLAVLQGLQIATVLFLLLNPKCLVNLHRSMISKHAAVIADQGRRTSVLADRRIHYV